MMRALLIGLVASSLVACQGARLPSAVPLPGSARGADGVEPAIVSIYAWHDEAGRPARMQGTAFFVEADVVVTNHHVVEGATRATLLSADGGEVEVVGLIGSDPDGDLVLLRVAQPLVGNPLALHLPLPAPGAHVRAVGSPEGLPQTAVEGRIGSRLVSFDILDEALMMTASIRPGMSGAPVLDTAGRVVGVLSRGTNVERQSYLVPSARITRMARTPLTPLAAWSRALRDDPDSVARAKFEEAADAFEIGDFERAIRLLRASIDSGLPSAGQATAWYVIGDGLSNLGRDADAIAAYRRSIHLRPRHALSHASLGAAWLRRDRAQAAIEAYTTALDLMPGSAAFNVGMGWARFQTRRYPEAYGAFRRAVQLAPDDASAWTGIAAACLELGRADEARTYAAYATALRPDVPHAYWVLASTYTRSGAWDDAADALEHGLAIEPGHAPALFELGRANVMRGNHGRATEQRRRLQQQDPRLASRLSALIDDGV